MKTTTSPSSAHADASGHTTTATPAAAVAPGDDLTRVHDLLAEFPTVMLATNEGVGESLAMRARPMRVARLDDDCTMSFLAGIDTAKAQELGASPACHAIAQGKAVFVSLRGALEVVRDRERIHAAWTPADAAYLPKGESDPDLCLLVLHPIEAEIWDVSGTKGIGYLFEAALALMAGKLPRRDAIGTMHDVVDLGAPQRA
ncbi:MAG: pyridoxamine 5'-phosphate oxidase family protein [Deltaproteobacteria bacterium]|nr:pyridoxamine 5'-phosphate oxidase family protein [Myxococcales bacterium]MDP3219112.1 pyridoxamine 5'-phosphate oxidase family protein [Deltaproteobacteria bacterium]